MTRTDAPRRVADIATERRLPDGARLRLDLRIEERAGNGRETVTHEPAPYRFLTLSIMGEHAPKGVRYGTNASSYGQVRDVLPADDPLRQLWDRWHLNDMRALCAHQSGSAADWQTIPPCTETGYQAGHAWLVELLPGDVLAEILRAFGCASLVLTHDGIAVDVTTNPGRRLHQLQGQSMHWAILHGGWDVIYPDDSRASHEIA